MTLRRRFLLPAMVAALASVATALPGRAAEPLPCRMNSSKQTCTIQPWGKEGFEITFSGSAIFRFTPAGPPTTDRRPMRDEQGRLWLMSGHHSFTLEEQGPNRNRIEVTDTSHGGSAGVKGKN